MAYRNCWRRLGTTASRLMRIGLAFTVVTATGCSVRSMAVDALADSLATNGDVYASDTDVEFVGLATPFALKTVESLLAESPNHRGLLLAAARGFTQYAYVYIQLKADVVEEHDVAEAYALRARARALYLRARDYGLRGLKTRVSGLTEQIGSAPIAALEKIEREDTALLYWTAAAWASAISLSKDDPAMLADLPTVEALIMRAYALDEAFGAGAIHVFLISYEMNRPGPANEAVAIATKHFNRAVALSAGAQAAPFVTYAQSVAVARQERAEFERMLKSALAVDEAAARPDWRLANEVMKRRARWLLGRIDNYFLD